MKNETVFNKSFYVFNIHYRN